MAEHVTYYAIVRLRRARCSSRSDSLAGNPALKVAVDEAFAP